MEEMQDFKRQYEELAARVEKIDEVGVLELKRVRILNLKLNNLKEGEYRKITKKEIGL